MSPRALLVSAITRAFHSRVVRACALRLAAQRAAALVLIYHRVGPDGAAAHEVVPTLHSARLAEHIDVLRELGDVVPLPDLLAAPVARRRPRFAITFDDDFAGHVPHTLPVLQAAGVQATFFLSGRPLHGLPPYWWTFLEAGVQVNGIANARQVLGLSGRTPAELAMSLERAPDVDRLMRVMPRPQERQMPPEDIRTLAAAGMTIGFHTLHHPMLTEVGDHDLPDALTCGWRELAEALGVPVTLLAYPYGRADRRVADAAARAGFAAAFASGGRPVVPSSNPFLLGRWDPGPLPPAQFASAVAARLLRRPTPPPS